MAAGLLLTGAPALADEGGDVRPVTMDPAEGGSSTQFTLDLPDGASCPGDSANDGYRVQSYMVPSTVDPEAITFNGLGPTPVVYGSYPDFRETLFDVDTNSFASVQTADAEAPGEPGPIINLPFFSFGVYSPGDLPAGRYHVGLACTLLNEIVTLWDTEIEVTGSPDDAPAQVSWRVIGAAGGEGGRSSSPALPVAGAAALALAALFLVRRRQSHPFTTSRETS
jgi:LPXTG-motif cell wall-anchored protein